MHNHPRGHNLQAILAMELLMGEIEEILEMLD
jgi:hypothetical protein